MQLGVDVVIGRTTNNGSPHTKDRTIEKRQWFDCSGHILVTCMLLWLPHSWKHERISLRNRNFIIIIWTHLLYWHMQWLWSHIQPSTHNKLTATSLKASSSNIIKYNHNMNTYPSQKKSHVYGTTSMQGIVNDKTPLTHVKEPTKPTRRDLMTIRKPWQTFLRVLNHNFQLQSTYTIYERHISTSLLLLAPRCKFQVWQELYNGLYKI